MNAATIADELNQPGAQRMLTKETLAYLAYAGPDGLPRVLPIGFLWTGFAIVVSTAATAPKVQALRDRPEVAITIAGGDTPSSSQAVSIRGTATVEIVDGVTEEYLESSRKAMQGEEAAQFEANVRSFYTQMARITITPHWARFYDYGTGRVPQFLQDLAAEAGG
ncbi:MAG: pyridoxamine 5'-phosphate oxidase family protein [Thermomicrobiales bacterium]